MAENAGRDPADGRLTNAILTRPAANASPISACTPVARSPRSGTDCTDAVVQADPTPSPTCSSPRKWGKNRRMIALAGGAANPATRRKDSRIFEQVKRLRLFERERPIGRAVDSRSPLGGSTVYQFTRL
jgi:hypothetical protein